MAEIIFLWLIKGYHTDEYIFIFRGLMMVIIVHLQSIWVWSLLGSDWY